MKQQYSDKSKLKIGSSNMNVFLVAEQLNAWLCLSVCLSICPFVSPKFLNEALQLLLDSGLFLDILADCCPDEQKRNGCKIVADNSGKSQLVNHYVFFCVFWGGGDKVLV